MGRPCHVKACGANDNVDFMMYAIFGCQALLIDALDISVYGFHIRLDECFQITIPRCQSAIMIESVMFSLAPRANVPTSNGPIWDEVFREHGMIVETPCHFGCHILLGNFGGFRVLVEYLEAMVHSILDLFSIEQKILRILGQSFDLIRLVIVPRAMSGRRSIGYITGIYCLISRSNGAACDMSPFCS